MGAGVGVVRWGKLSSLPTSQDRENPNAKHGLLTTFNLHAAPSRHGRTSNTHTTQLSTHYGEPPHPAKWSHQGMYASLYGRQCAKHFAHINSLLTGTLFGRFYYHVYIEMTEHRKINVPRVKQQVHSRARRQTWQSGPRVHAFNLHRARLFIINKWQYYLIYKSNF